MSMVVVIIGLFIKKPVLA